MPTLKDYPHQTTGSCPTGATDSNRNSQHCAETAPARLVHGDAHVGNLLRDSERRVLLCDFDATCVGPWEVDLVAVPVGEIRFGRSGVHQRLAAAYGYDITASPNWPLLREARELKMVVAAVPLMASSPAAANEFAVRLGTIQRGDTTGRWTPFADLTTSAGAAVNGGDQMAH